MPIRPQLVNGVQVYGSIDPNSGTAILSETVRALTQAARDRVWTPRRTVIFCNWDGEEHGLVGSAEFVENYQQQLMRRAVAYLNVDLIYGNGSFAASTLPTLYDVVVESARRVPNPLKAEVRAGRPTVYDTWLRELPGTIEGRPDLPDLPAPGGGSDHERFMSYLGVPVVDFRFVRHDKNPRTNTTYPLYHSLYETPFVNEHIFDHDDFAVHAATARYWANLARMLSEEPIAPLNVSSLAHRFLDGYVRDLKLTVEALSKRFPRMDLVIQQTALLVRNVQEFVRRADAFHKRLAVGPRAPLYEAYVDGMDEDYEDDAVTIDELRLRSINDRLMSVDRCFVSPTAVPGSPTNRNILYSTSDLNSYDSKVMPAIYDEVNALLNAKTTRQQEAAMKRLTEQISIMQYSVQCAANALSEIL